MVAIPRISGTGRNSHVIAREDDDRRREVVDSLNHGMAIVDDSGSITLWDDGAERLFACSREHVLGHTIASAVPGLGNAALSQAITQVQNERLARKLPQLRSTSGADARTLEIRIVPVSGGVALLCHDVTEHAEAEQALRRSEGRLALAAEGANDGLWQLDLRNKEFYVSARWKAMLGLPAVAAPDNSRTGSTGSILTTSRLSERRSTRASPAQRTSFIANTAYGTRMAPSADS